MILYDRFWANHWLSNQVNLKSGSTLARTIKDEEMRCIGLCVLKINVACFGIRDSTPQIQDAKLN